MPDQPQVPDPLEFMKSLWTGMGLPMPGMVTPTLDVGELDKRIADLRAVEGWLKMNLGMLQMSIQALEMQRNTLAAMQAVAGAGGADPKAHAFANPAMWPWPFLQQAASAAPDAAKAHETPRAK